MPQTREGPPEIYVTKTGGAILGQRDLALDRVEPWEFRGAEFHLNSNVYRGLRLVVRPQRESDRSLPILSTWGFNVPLIIAEAEFVTRKRIVE